MTTLKWTHFSLDSQIEMFEQLKYRLMNTTAYTYTCTRTDISMDWLYVLQND